MRAFPDLAEGALSQGLANDVVANLSVVLLARSTLASLGRLAIVLFLVQMLVFEISESLLELSLKTLALCHRLLLRWRVRLSGI